MSKGLAIVYSIDVSPHNPFMGRLGGDDDIDNESEGKESEFFSETDDSELGGSDDDEDQVVRIIRTVYSAVVPNAQVAERARARATRLERVAARRITPVAANDLAAVSSAMDDA
eukprot:6303669-Pyramimonas_sp.AAC.1